MGEDVNDIEFRIKGLRDHAGAVRAKEKGCWNRCNVNMMAFVVVWHCDGVRDREDCRNSQPSRQNSQTLLKDEK